MNKYLMTLLVLAVFCSACGPSKAELSLEQANKKQAAVKVALDKYADLRRVTSGDTAVILSQEMEGKLEAVGLGLNDISVTQGELQSLVRAAYGADARRQLGILGSKRTGPEEAQKARVEFYRVQKLSDRPISAFGVSAKSVDLLVASAHHRAALANGYRDPVIRKASTVRRRR